MTASGNGGILAEFKKFIMRGNVVDLAVAVIVGGAFGKIVESFVADIITPAILAPALQAANVDDLSRLSAGGIKYGSFLAAVLNFLVIALSIFLVVQAFEAARKRFVRQNAAEEVAPTDPIVISQENLTHAVERLTQVIESK
ncbi:MAG: large conductance mechanosensitive channel protein MscL [Drouetiella hepatica Uher 2000/2452]|uniref:Large-conductance mechanosensitive channel n=1 Tax=Drouetiella hepatica Uher 2000/2452 TaxID=904376 RepID=A0A951QAD1_9CYAN|nr:large conductance mechanosensitive channel protein MscL [Drouetiella hepatica Uher 2000/2452]